MFAQREAGGSYGKEWYTYTTSSVSSSVLKGYFLCVFTILNKAYKKGTRHRLDLDISMKISVVATIGEKRPDGSIFVSVRERDLIYDCGR